jgi:hypothetical protein
MTMKSMLALGAAAMLVAGVAPANGDSNRVSEGRVVDLPGRGNAPGLQDASILRRVSETRELSAQNGAGSGRRTTSPVYTTWDSVTVVGRSALVRNEKGVAATFETSNLPPGRAVTLWFGVFNNPAACATRPCTPADAGNPDVQGDFLWGAGHIVGASGKGAFAGRLAVGDASGSAFIEFGMPQAAVGLLDPWNAEIILLLHSHGPSLTGQALKQQLTSFLGGCDVFLGGPDGFAEGPDDLPTNVGECTTFQESTHQ